MLNARQMALHQATNPSPSSPNKKGTPGPQVSDTLVLHGFHGVLKVGRSRSEAHLAARRRRTVDGSELLGSRVGGSHAGALLQEKKLESPSAGMAGILTASQSQSSRASAAAAGLDHQPADRAAILARRHRLELHEVRRILKQFEEAGRGGLSKADFNKVLCSIFEAEGIKPEVLDSAYTVSNCAQQVDIDMFLMWYVQNMFSVVTVMNAGSDRAAADKKVYQLAKDHNVTAVEIDKIQLKFKQFDANGSGHLDFDEFQEMMRVILKVRSISELIPDRIHRFWREIDKDGNGYVDIDEFTEWFLKYFHTDFENGEDISSTALLEAYYDSYNPTVQRHQIAEARRSSTIDSAS